MLLIITTTATIDCKTGGVETRTTWRVEGQEAALGPALAQALAEMTRAGVSPGAVDVATTSAAPAVGAAPYDAKARPSHLNKARHLAGLLRLPPEELEKALTTRPPERVREVLEWIQSRRTTMPVKSIAGLFWSIVSKD